MIYDELSRHLGIDLMSRLPRGVRADRRWLGGIRCVSCSLACWRKVRPACGLAGVRTLSTPSPPLSMCSLGSSRPGSFDRGSLCRVALFALLLGCWLGCVDDWPRLFDLVWFSENLKEKKTKSEKLFSRFRNVYTFASRENRQFSRSARFARLEKIIFQHCIR